MSASTAHILKISIYVVLNPDGEKVSAVYYYETDGSGEILLYGEQQNPSGVLIKQPKLMLFIVFSILSATFCLVLLIIFRCRLFCNKGFL